MRYFHRTSATPDAVLNAAKAFFGSRLTPAEEAPRRRAYSGAIGKVLIAVTPEGGHYTRVDVTTDQVGEAEIDKLAKRFLSEVHKMAEPAHEVRGAY